MSRKSEHVQRAITAKAIALYDESMDDPTDRNPWTICIPGSYTIAKFSDYDTAKVVLDILNPPTT